MKISVVMYERTKTQSGNYVSNRSSMLELDCSVVKDTQSESIEELLFNIEVSLNSSPLLANKRFHINIGQESI